MPAGWPTTPFTGPIKWHLISSGMVIRFIVSSRYTYAAVAIYEDSTPYWYITGSGLWFHTNKLTNDQMSEVLMRDSTSDILIADSYTPAEVVLT